ncbi:MAG: IS110 family transposase [Candidatus Methylomirabilales bacterium]
MFVGIDYHKRYSQATVMDQDGHIVEQGRFPNTPQAIRTFVDRLPAGSQIALEATGSWYHFYEVLEETVPQVHLAHPLKTRAIADARIKTDTIDATMLAHLLRTNLLPTSYIPPREIRDMRETLRYRASLVALRTSLKNKVHAILSKNGIQLRWSNIFGKQARQELKVLPVRPCYREELNGYLHLARTLQRLIAEVTETIKQLVQDNPQATLLTTIPGISYYSALLIVSEIGEIARFRSAKKLTSYAGLVPSVYSSGGKTRHGPITKQGSKWLRWILVELSHHFVTGSTRLEKLYERVTRRHGKPTARVAVAREMLKIIYSMLRDRRPFYPDGPAVSLGS